MTPENIYEISRFASKLNNNLLGESFEKTILTELYRFFEAETTAFILRDTFKDSSFLSCFEIKDGKYTEDRLSIRAFTDRFDFSIFDVDTQQGVVEDLSVGITQKVLHFRAQGVDSLIVLKDIRKRDFLHDSLFKLIVSILCLSIKTWITIRELYRTITIQQYRKDLNNLDHELRSLLSAIKTANQSLLSKDMENKESKALHESIQRATDELTGILDDIHEARKIEQESIKGRIEDINLFEIINEILEGVKPLSLSKNISVNIKGTKDALIEGNRDWLRQAFYHLILNAVKYNRINGSVEINIDEKKNRYLIKIMDTGIGIPDGIKEGIFNKYVRGMGHEKGGSGIGLYIVKKSVEAHKGEISFESSKGKGTRFYIEFPKRGKGKKTKAFLYILIIFFLLIINLFPIIPGRPEISKTKEGFTVLKLKEGSILRIQTPSGIDYSYFNTILKYRGRLNLTIQEGIVNIDSGRTSLSLHTPYGIITSNGSSFEVSVKEDSLGISVFEGHIRFGDEIIEYGEGALIDNDGITIVPILYRVKNVNYKNDDDGKLRLRWMAIDDALSYILVIAKDPFFSEIITLIETDTEHAETIIKEDGYYYLRIYPSDEHSLKGFPATFRLKNFYHLSRGLYERKRGNHEAALKEFRLSLDAFMGKEEQPVSEIAWTYYLLGNYDMAERKFKEALEIRKTDRSLFGLARVYLFKQDPKSSERLYKEILSRNPENSDALWGIADLYLKKGNISDAEKYLIKLSEIDNRYPLLNYLIAKMYLLKGNKKEAIKYLNLELKYNPESKEASDLLKKLHVEGR